MKRYLILVLVISIVLIVFAFMNFSVDKNPDEEQIKAICELSTLECYFNNVAKSTKESGKGVSHFLEKDREFWIEYEGVAKIGIDMKKVSMKIHKNDITISIPNAELMNISIVKETLNKNSYIYSDDGLNKNQITAEEQQSAVESAQKTMKESVLKNQTLFERAEKIAKDLIENYINKLSDVSGKKYNIIWKEV